MALTILHDPDPRLREVSKEISEADLQSEETQVLIDAMIDAMKEANGVGLAAPQVGVHKRIIVLDDGNGPEVYVNPRISGTSWKKLDSEEGCLSVPGIWGMVKRHQKVHVRALDRNGVKVSVKSKGLKAIIFQHEIDHLNGVLFIDQVEKFTNPAQL